MTGRTIWAKSQIPLPKPPTTQRPRRLRKMPLAMTTWAAAFWPLCARIVQRRLKRAKHVEDFVEGEDSHGGQRRSGS